MIPKEDDSLVLFVYPWEAFGYPRVGLSPVKTTSLKDAKTELAIFRQDAHLCSWDWIFQGLV